AAPPKQEAPPPKPEAPPQRTPPPTPVKPVVTAAPPAVHSVPPMQPSEGFLRNLARKTEALKSIPHLPAGPTPTFVVPFAMVALQPPLFLRDEEARRQLFMMVFQDLAERFQPTDRLYRWSSNGLVAVVERASGLAPLQKE